MLGNQGLGAWLRLPSYDAASLPAVEKRDAAEMPTTYPAEIHEETVSARNWKEYESRLRRRGDLNIGFSEGYRKINGGLATIAK